MAVAPSIDLAIVGASFAGLACARTAAMLGLRVVVVDAKPEAGARVRTTGILVREVIDDIDLPAHLMRRVRGVRLYGSGPHPAELWAPGYYFAVTDTPNLLRWLAAEARRAGAEFWLSTRLTGATADADGVTLHLTSQGEPVVLKARLVVGADGARSAIARAFGLGRSRHWLTGAELGFRLDGDGIDRRFLHCVLTTRHAPGYIGWVVPGMGVTQIGVAATKDRRPDLSGFLADIAARLKLDPALLAPDRAVERRAGRIPAAGRVSPIGTDRVVLVGDAAGLVSPLTGGGIRLALASGRQAALAAADHVIEGGPAPADQLLKIYPRLWSRRWLRTMLENRPLAATLAASLGNPLVRLAAQRVFFHRTRAWPLVDRQAETPDPAPAPLSADPEEPAS